MLLLPRTMLHMPYPFIRPARRAEIEPRGSVGSPPSVPFTYSTFLVNIIVNASVETITQTLYLDLEYSTIHTLCVVL